MSRCSYHILACLPFLGRCSEGFVTLLTGKNCISLHPRAQGFPPLFSYLAPPKFPFFVLREGGHRSSELVFTYITASGHVRVAKGCSESSSPSSALARIKALSKVSCLSICCKDPHLGVVRQGKLTDLETELVELNGNAERLQKSFSELVELQLVLEKAGSFFDDAQHRATSAAFDRPDCELICFLLNFF